MIASQDVAPFQLISSVESAETEFRPWGSFTTLEEGLDRSPSGKPRGDQIGVN